MQVLILTCCDLFFSLLRRGPLLEHCQIVAAQGHLPLKGHLLIISLLFPKFLGSLAPVPPPLPIHPTTCLGLLFPGIRAMSATPVTVLRRGASLEILTSDTLPQERKLGNNEKREHVETATVLSLNPWKTEKEISSFYKRPSSERRLLLHTLCRDDLSKS